jgi:hypothetical protein
MHFLKQSTAVTVKIGPFVDATDGATAETGLTISQADIRLTKNGGNIAQSNDATGATHDELGYYDVPLDATDTNTLGRLRVLVSESGALPVWSDYMVMPPNVWDSLFGADALQVHAVEIANDLITAAAIATNAIDADAMADGAITAATFAAGAIDATAIAADAIGSSELAATAINEIADGILDRDMSTGTDSGSPSVRTVRQALRFLRNRWTAAAGTLTVYKEDDSTSSWTAALTADAAADPITGSDPAS